jgi:hypothetical protein
MPSASQCGIRRCQSLIRVRSQLPFSEVAVTVAVTIAAWRWPIARRIANIAPQRHDQRYANTASAVTTPHVLCDSRHHTRTRPQLSYGRFAPGAQSGKDRYLISSRETLLNSSRWTPLGPVKGEIIMRNLGDAPRHENLYGAGEWVKMQYVLRGYGLKHSFSLLPEPRHQPGC